MFSGKNIEDNYRGIRIINHELPEDFFGFLKSLGVTHYPKYSAKIEGMLVYTKEKSYLKQLIGIYLDGKTLGNDMNFRNLKEDFADNSTFIWIGDTYNLKDAWKKDKVFVV